LSTEGETRRISKAVKQLSDNFSETLKIEDIAQDLGMSVSSFHHHFKSVTAMSPVQFQKRLRLQEARRLMLGEDMDVASAGFKVGYDNPAYFSREYKKHFGAPPQRDIANLRINLGQKFIRQNNFYDKNQLQTSMTKINSKLIFYCSANTKFGKSENTQLYLSVR
jgi:AraC-like DNA-binding protein